LDELLRVFKGEDGAMWVNKLEPFLVTNNSVVSRSDYVKIFPKYEKLHRDLIESHRSFSEALQDLGTSLEASSMAINREEESKNQPSDQLSHDIDRIIRFNNGDVYTGDILNGNPHGLGKMVRADGRTYSGGWKLGLPDGVGEATWPDGGRHIGEYKRGKSNGYGIHLYEDGIIYLGQWKQYKRHGKGKEILPDGDVYDGDYVDNYLEGFGTHTFADGRVRRGNWKDDKEHG
jgi:hypothetical protein